ncbi:RnfABCDGE type electron transport complex subunit D [Treponema sp.]|uniref:RnfABCDGE type electron transport complex subunit D n=1 Tax=Treponema sp. TaxID=166 RepID=UPI003F09F481
MIYTDLKKCCGNITLSPFVCASYSVGTVSFVFIGLLLVQAAMLVITGSYSSLAVLLSALLASVASEAFFCFFRRDAFHAWRFSVVQGLVIGLLLPCTYSLPVVFAAVFLTLLLGKFVFGNFAGSWANLSALCVAVLYFLNPSAFPPFAVSAQDLQSRNAALALIQSGSVPILNIDSVITDFLNSYVFKLFGISIPEGYVSLFWDNGSAIPAFRFNLVTLVSSIVLVSLDMVDYVVPAVFLFVYSIFVRLLLPFLVGGIAFQGDILLALLTSGTLFCTLYLLQYYGTVPMTLEGKILYGAAAGIAGFLIIGSGTSSSGFVFLVLAVNLISPVIQFLEDRKLYESASKKLVPLLRESQEA